MVQFIGWMAIFYFIFFSEPGKSLLRFFGGFLLGWAG